MKRSGHPFSTQYTGQVVAHNLSPAKRAAIHLAVTAGSLLEDPDQLGFAHYLEHMAFNGTKNFPGTTLVDFIENSGIRFGADASVFEKGVGFGLSPAAKWWQGFFLRRRSVPWEGFWEDLRASPLRTDSLVLTRHQDGSLVAGLM